MKKILPYIVILFLSSCLRFDNHVPEQVMPEVTSEGLDKVGCYVNGEIWIPNGMNKFSISGGPFVPSWTAAVNQSKGEFFFGANKYSSDHQELGHLYFNISSLNNMMFKLDSLNSGFSDLYHKEPSYAVYKGELQLSRYDSAAQIISGVFWLEAARHSDTVRITGGRFDVHYEAY